MIDLANYEGIQAVMVVLWVFLHGSSYVVDPTVHTSIRVSAVPLSVLP